jgi:hypothetical protein
MNDNGQQIPPAMAEFIEERTRVGPALEVTAADLYTAYLDWAQHLGLRWRTARRRSARF